MSRYYQYRICYYAPGPNGPRLRRRGPAALDAARRGGVAAGAGAVDGRTMVRAGGAGARSTRSWFISTSKCLSAELAGGGDPGCATAGGTFVLSRFGPLGRPAPPAPLAPFSDGCVACCGDGCWAGSWAGSRDARCAPCWPAGGSSPGPEGGAPPSSPPPPWGWLCNEGCSSPCGWPCGCCCPRLAALPATTADRRPAAGPARTVVRHLVTGSATTAARRRSAGSAATASRAFVLGSPWRQAETGPDAAACGTNPGDGCAGSMAS